MRMSPKRTMPFIIGTLLLPLRFAAGQVGVSVSPVSATDPISRHANSTGNTVIFTVTNTGTFDTQYSRTCTFSGNVASVSCTALGGS